MSDKQTLAEAIGYEKSQADAWNAIHLNDEVYGAEARRQAAHAAVKHYHGRFKLERVQSGEIVTPEMEALAKIDPMSEYNNSVEPGCDDDDYGEQCDVCLVEWRKSWGPNVEHADDCVYVRACRITGENQ